ncbi:hypothetical protein SAMN05444166_5004 [Singulisphaera sp. GP187]|nr:hypothetical protein SAMN05444166_5004 [Singulisphaera sp. GP187]
MKANPSSLPAPATRTVIRQMTLVLPPLLWCMGFFLSIGFPGCHVSRAIMNATAYTLSGFAGWVVYRFVRRPSDASTTDLWMAFPFAANINITLLNPRIVHWPFREMLAHGLIVSVACMALIGLVQRLLRQGKRARSARAHPLSDDQVDSAIEPLRETNCPT